MNAVNELEPVKSLAVNLNTTSLAELNTQREMLKQFIKGQLTQDVDFGMIPGTPKPSLYKPGAEKLCKLFQLGSRIVGRDKEIDLKDNFAMFTYTTEVFYLPTGNGIAQCEGSANSQERKYSEKTIYENGKPKKIPQRAADLLNTLQKMAQKRSYVGATIIATGASDFFTQDLEDMPRDTFQNASGPANSNPKPTNPPIQTNAPRSGAHCEVCGNELVLSKSGAGFYCQNFKDKTKGEHSRVKFADLESFKQEQNVDRDLLTDGDEKL